MEIPMRMIYRFSYKTNFYENKLNFEIPNDVMQMYKYYLSDIVLFGSRGFLIANFTLVLHFTAIASPYLFLTQPDHILDRSMHSWL